MEMQSEYTIILSVDYGTSNLAISFRLVRYDQFGVAQGFPAVPMNFCGTRTLEAPQEVAWDAQGNFIWGFGVQSAIGRRSIAADDVISLFKLCLYPDLKTSELSKQVEAQLQNCGKTLNHLLEDHFKAIIGEAKRSLKQGSTLFHHTAAAIEAMPVKLFLSVPQMWKATGNERMVKAAKAAGFVQVELFYEPQSAAAFILEELRQMGSLPTHLQPGSGIVVSDSGGGTGDFVPYDLVDDSTNGIHVTLRLAKQPKGALCGSQMINLNFLKWLKTEGCPAATAMTFAQKCSQLGRSQLDVCRSINTQFEKYKREYTQGNQELQYISIGPAPDVQVQVWNVPLSNPQLESFMIPVFNENIEHIRSQLTPNTTTIAVVGGMANSALFMDLVNNTFSGQYVVIGAANQRATAENNVSQGAQLRYGDIDTSNLRATGSFGISQEEEFDPLRHHDAIRNPWHAQYHRGPKDPKGGLVVNAVLGYEDPDSEKSYVYKRWAPLLKKGDVVQSGQPYTNSLWQLDYVTPNQKTLRRDVYWTAEDDLDEGAPMLKEKGSKAVKVQHFEPWGSLKMNCLNWSKKGFQLRQYKREKLDQQIPEAGDDADYDPREDREDKKTPQKKSAARKPRPKTPARKRATLNEDEEEGPGCDMVDVYEVWSKITIECDGANVQFKWFVAKAGTQPYDAEGHEIANKTMDQLLTEEKVLQLIEADFNPNPAG